MKMGLRDWLYRFRYGVFVSLVYIFISVLLIPFGSYSELIGIYYWAYPSLIILVPLSKIIHLEKILDVGNDTVSLILVLCVSVIVYFIIGTIIGWVVDKIKKRR